MEISPNSGNSAEIAFQLGYSSSMYHPLLNPYSLFRVRLLNKLLIYESLIQGLLLGESNLREFLFCFDKFLGSS